MEGFHGLNDAISSNELQFPVAFVIILVISITIANYHQLNGLNNRTFLSQFNDQNNSKIRFFVGPFPCF